jgi:hypothetical protein
VDLVQFIRNASSITNMAEIKPQRGQLEYGTKRITRNVVDQDTRPEMSESESESEDPLSTDYLNDLRHSSLSDWKKKKKEMRLAQKASGVKPPPESGIIAQEFEDLSAEVGKGGRMVKAPCTPPHCTFRCLTDEPCTTHPLMKTWTPPKPRVCGSRYIYPISFGVPESEVVECVPMKTAEFGTVVPLREKSYVFGPADEAEYKV